MLFTIGIAFQCMNIPGQLLWQRKLFSQSVVLGEVRRLSDSGCALSLPSVPVIAIFTKFDALHTVAFGELRDQGKGVRDAVAMAPKQAEHMFENGDYCGMLQATEFPPKSFVCMAGELIIYNDIEQIKFVFEGMDKEHADCTALIKCTAEALDDDMLETLLVSAQQVNLEICVNYAVRRKAIDDFAALNSSDKFYFRTLRRFLSNADISQAPQQEYDWVMQSNLAVWFPHIYVGVKD